MRSIQVSFVVLTCITLFGSAHAMCGGGGWKGGVKPTATSASATATTAVTTTPVNATATTPANHAVQAPVAYQAAPVVPASQSTEATYFPASAFLDTSRLDTITARLNLSDDQKNRIASARQSISQQSETLNQSRAKAERLFDACNGECESQRYRLRRAADAADRYSPNTEFNTQLRTILDAKQIAIYDGREEVSTAK